MNRHNIQEATKAARVFLARAKTVMDVTRNYNGGPCSPIWEHPKETGALKRASMELTRALSEMRK